MKTLTEIFKTAAVAMLFVAVCKAAPDLTENPWYKNALVGMEIGPTGAQFGYSDSNDVRYCSQFDGREIVRHAISAHCEYIVIWARDGDYAYYESKILPRAPGLGKRNPLRDAIDEAHRHNLPVIAYCVVQQGGHFLKAHPEWEMRDANGKSIGRFCYNSGYLEAMKKIVAEILAYGIDGFHIDMLDQGFEPPYGCWCDTCRAQFEREFGHPMPTGPTWNALWDEMLEFRYHSSERFEKELYAYIKSINPRATVDFNYHGGPPFSFEVGQRPVQHAGNGDFITGETGVWGFSALTVGLNAEFYRAAVPHQRVQVAMQRGVRMYHDQTTRPLNDIRWELLTLLAHNAFVTMVDKTGFDGWLDPIAYERIGSAFRDAQEKREHFGQTPVQEVGIYFSSRTRDWVGREKPENYFQSFQGAHKAMVYEHIPYGVVLDENVTIETLKRFPIILLPNTGILSGKEVGLLRHYVEEGGKLIITGQSGIFDRMGKTLGESALSEIIGAKVVRMLDSLDNWIAISEIGDTFSQLSSDIPTNWPFLVKGPAVVYEPTTASAVCKLLKPHRTTRQLENKESTDWPMSAEVPVGPAMLLNNVGKGKVLTFAGSPDFATASEHHIVEARRLLRNAVRFLNSTPRVKIIAPVSVESVITDDTANRTLRIHLLGYNSPPQTTPAKNRPYVLPMPVEDAPMYRVIVETSEPVIQATAWNKSTRLTHSEHKVEAVVNDIHEILILRYK